MNRADETTTPIKRDELLQLLSVMTPTAQPITVRARISDVEAELARQVDAARTTAVRKAAKAAKKSARKAARKVAKREAMKAAAAKAPPPNDLPRLFSDVDWDELLTAAVLAMTAPPASQTKRRYARPFSQVAAVLPPSVPTRFPRATRPPPFVRAKTPTGPLPETPRAEPKVASEPLSFPTLSPQVAAALSAEEIAMLPMEIRLTLPEVPVSDVIEIHAAPCTELGQSIRVTPRAADPRRFATILTSFAATFLVGFFALYFLI